MNLAKHILAVLILALLVVRCNKTKNEKPNVILIMVDDQGYGDLSCLGNEHIQTPNLDQLHKVSARFTDYHVSPTCAPTRAAILTGHHSNRTGVWYTVNGRSLLLERETTMAQVFKENGYSTAILFESAKKFIEQKKDQPFFCYLSTNAAHSPYFVEDKYAAPYQNNENIPNAAFYGMISNIDENIGKLVDYLRSIKLMDNTILIFTTDNGTAAGAKVEGHRLDGFVVKGNNAGMRGIKASMYEGGHRVPLFIHWKNGGISTGKDINELTAHYDIFPSLVDLCQLTISPKTKFDGQSLVPLIKGNKAGFEDRIVITNSQRIEIQIGFIR